MEQAKQIRWRVEYAQCTITVWLETGGKGNSSTLHSGLGPHPLQMDLAEELHPDMLIQRNQSSCDIVRTVPRSFVNCYRSISSLLEILRSCDRHNGIVPGLKDIANPAGKCIHSSLQLVNTSDGVSIADPNVPIQHVLHPIVRY